MFFVADGRNLLWRSIEDNLAASSPVAGCGQASIDDFPVSVDDSLRHKA